MKIAWNIMLTYISTPYAAMPFSPAYLMSCTLNSMETIDMEMLFKSSEEPLLHVLDSAQRSSLHVPRRSGLSFSRPK